MIFSLRCTVLTFNTAECYALTAAHAAAMHSSSLHYIVYLIPSALLRYLLLVCSFFLTPLLLLLLLLLPLLLLLLLLLTLTTDSDFDYCDTVRVALCVLPCSDDAVCSSSDGAVCATPPMSCVLLLRQ